MFGTTDGQLLVMSATGAMLTQVVMQDGVEITSMAWSCEKFGLSEQDADIAADHDKSESKWSRNSFKVELWHP